MSLEMTPTMETMWKEELAQVLPIRLAAVYRGISVRKSEANPLEQRYFVGDSEGCHTLYFRKLMEALDFIDVHWDIICRSIEFFVAVKGFVMVVPRITCRVCNGPRTAGGLLFDDDKLCTRFIEELKEVARERGPRANKGVHRSFHRKAPRGSL